MKRNRIYWLFSLVLVLTLVSFTLVSGTYAKYTTTLTASDTARVAKFDIKITGDNIDTIKGASNTVDLFAIAADVNVDDTEKVIAPGTNGTFTITVDNLSEVTVLPELVLTATNANNIPLTFTYKTVPYVTNGLTYTNIADMELLEDALNADLALIGNMAPLAVGVPLVVTWVWPFVGVDATDTALGLVGTAACVLTVAVTVTQVD